MSADAIRRCLEQKMAHRTAAAITSHSRDVHAESTPPELMHLVSRAAPNVLETVNISSDKQVRTLKLVRCSCHGCKRYIQEINTWRQ
jgi:hypothetical protein